MTSILDTDHGAAVEFGTATRNDRRESGDNVCSTGVAQTENDDLSSLAPRQRCNFTKIEVERQENPIFLDRFAEDLRIR